MKSFVFTGMIPPILWKGNIPRLSISILVHSIFLFQATLQAQPASSSMSPKAISKSQPPLHAKSRILSPSQFSRAHIDFDSDWKFHLGHASDPGQDFNYGLKAIFSKSGKSDGTAIAPDFDDKAWRTLQLPHDWAVELPFENSTDSDVMAHGYKPVGGHYPGNSIGWYRKHFTVARKDSGQRFAVQFDGIFRDSRVWVNGFYLGNNLSGYNGMSYDITDYLNYDKENVVVVRVDATQYEGWFYEGAGIYRHVWLNQYNPLHVVPDGVFVHTQVLSNRATVTVETTVINQAPGVADCNVFARIADREGRIVGLSTAQSLRMQGNETRTVHQTIAVSGPELWSPEDPYLYRATAVITGATQNSAGDQIAAGNQTIDAVKIRFGIRTIRLDSSGLYVNGKYTKVKGVNCHQDHAGVGSAIPDYLQYYRIRLLRQMGANAYRTSHNPPTPELLDACDSLGMLVLDENRLLNSSPEYLGQFERLILRDRSRPSVFLWCIGNEEALVQKTAIGRRIAQTLLARQKELDPTRLCSYGADLANVHEGINEVIPVRGFNYRIAGVEPYHREYPGQPIIGTEMGSTVTTRGIYVKDSVAGYLPDGDITYPWWANTAEQWWTMAADRPWWTGGFIWTGFDYRGEPTPYQWPNINSHFGVMDMCGFPKNIYYYYQSWWVDTGVDVLHISPHWNWKGRERQPVDVWINTNADAVELFLNGRSLGRKVMPLNKHLQWSVSYEAGKLEAIAFKKGRKFTASVETTSAPYEVVVTPYKTTMIADGKDATVINISVVDRQGREVPDAGDLIRFSVKGDLHILGVGNGDPSSHEPDKCPDSNWQRHLFNGKCQVILQSGSSSGQFRFDAAGAGLQSGSTDIYTVTPGVPHAVQPVHRLIPDLSNAIQPVPAITPRLSHPIHPAIKSIRPKQVDKMLGADISFLPELENEGIKFSDRGVQKDAIQILKDHGFNYIRLRIFTNPSNDSGYSPGKGFCDLEHTRQMARRIKAAGMKFLLDFHYSDYWADPGKQFKPAAWVGKDFSALSDSVYAYTRAVMLSLKSQGTIPDMVQVGNEINHGMIWPEGRISSPDSLAQLIYAGISGVKSVDTAVVVMLHMALGGQNDESHFFLDNMLERGLPFDVIGLSYYPKWHGTPADLKYNVDDLAKKYRKDVIIVEYSQMKREVNKIAFAIPGGRGKGTCIWEPLNTWESIFDKHGSSNDYLLIYDELKNYLLP